MTEEEKNGEYIDNSGNKFNAEVMLPCPCCGGEPIALFKGNDHTSNRAITIKCKSCRLQRKDAALIHSHKWIVKRCIESWNKRTIKQQLEE